MKKLMRTFKQLSILFLAITFFGCEDDDAVLPKVNADFTYEINTDTGTVTFINTSEQATTYSWDLGDDTSSTLINPVNVYVNGTYTIVLTASNVAGSSDTVEYTITINIPLAVTLPITFDDDNVKYEAVAFEGAAFDIVDNPAPGGSNDKASKVGSITNSGATYEGLFFELGTDVDLDANKTITMNFWADAAVDVLMKLEEGSTSTPDVIVSHSGSGWEELSFIFTATSKYSKLVIFVDGPGTTDGTFYMDDIIQVKSAPVITLNGTDPLSILIGSTFTDPGATAIDAYGVDITSDIVIAGDTVDTNTAGTYIITYNVSDDTGKAASEVTRTVIVAADIVAPVITLTGSDTINVTLGDAFTDPGATATDNVDGDITTSIVVSGDTVDVNTAGTYTITYNVSDAAGNPATEVTRTVTVAAPSACTGETTESYSAADLNMTFLTDPSAFVISDGAGFEWIDNPDSDNAVNTSCKVGQITKSGQFPYDNNQFDLDGKLDFNNNSGLKIKVWSGLADTQVRIKLEEIGNPGNKVEQELTTSVISGWEELIFPFSSADSDKFNKIVIFFDLDENNTDTYYFDDLALYGDGGGTGGGGGTPGTAEGDIAENGGFEDGNFDGWAVYNNSGTIEVVTTDPSSGTYCAYLYASPETGLNPTLKQERKAAGTLAVGDQVQIKFDYKGALTGESGTYSIQSFVEAGAGVNQVENITVNPTETWQTHTQTYTVAAGDVSGGITLEFVAICGGVPGCSSTLYLDNISVIINP
mgnify:FL=1